VTKIETFKITIKGGFMKSLVTFLSVLLFASLAPAQNPPPAPTGNPHDTVQQIPERDAAQMLCPHGKRMFPGHGMNFRADMMQPGCCEQGFAEMEKGNRHRWEGPCFMHHRAFFMHAILKLLFLGFILINVLLTIIVSLDMARNGRFNGLWIPVILLAGIPGSMIYALFRIGDRIPCKSST
jgi:hypothetical protein